MPKKNNIPVWDARRLALECRRASATSIFFDVSIRRFSKTTYRRDRAWVGGWIGLLAAFFIAGRVRRIAKYTVPDLLEQRYNATARFLGSVAIILAYVTIAAYQFRGGGWILSIVTDGAISPTEGMYITAGAIVLFTAMAGMMSIVTVDIFNGTIITLGVLFALPYMVFEQGGIAQVMANLPEGHSTVLGGHNVLWVLGLAMPTFLLILGESGMYQKFFSAKGLLR